MAVCLHNFKGYGDVDLGEDDQLDEEDDTAGSYIGMDVTPAINSALHPKTYTLPRDHPFATNFLSAEEGKIEVSLCFC